MRSNSPDGSNGHIQVVLSLPVPSFTHTQGCRSVTVSTDRTLPQGCG